MSTSPLFRDSSPDENKRDLSALLPVLIVLFVVGLALMAYINFRSGAKATSSGVITRVAVAELSSKTSVLVSVELKVKDLDQQPLVVYSVQVRLKAGGQQYMDSASAAMHLPSYFKAYPELKSDAAPLMVDSKIAPGEERLGIVAIDFPVTKDAFDKRESLEVVVNFREHRTLVLKQ